jgi:hypothetical protein
MAVFFVRQNKMALFLNFERTVFYDETLPYFWLGGAGPSDVLHR